MLTPGAVVFGSETSATTCRSARSRRRRRSERGGRGDRRRGGGTWRRGRDRRALAAGRLDRPFVLSPFVVECRTGEGFPIREIAGRIVEATESSTVLASTVPAIADAPAQVSSSRPSSAPRSSGSPERDSACRDRCLSLEQVRMVSRLRAVSSGSGVADELPVLAARAAAIVVRPVSPSEASPARRARSCPEPVAHAAVAAAGTWALARALRSLESLERRV